MELTVEKVLELLEQATPGPWSSHHRAKYNDWRVTTPDPEGTLMRLSLLGSDDLTSNHRRGDIALIAAAPDLARLALSFHTQLKQERRARLAAEHELGCLYGPIRAARRHLDGTPVLFSQRDPGAVLRQLQRAEAQLERLFPDLQSEPQAQAEGEA